MSASILKALGLAASESGTYLGNGEWSKATSAGTIEVVNPSTHEIIGRVHASSAADYDTIVQRAQEAFKVPFGCLTRYEAEGARHEVPPYKLLVTRYVRKPFDSRSIPRLRDAKTRALPADTAASEPL